MPGREVQLRGGKWLILLVRIAGGGNRELCALCGPAWLILGLVSPEFTSNVYEWKIRPYMP